MLPKVPPPLNQPFCGRCGHAVSDHFVATGTTAASSTKSTTSSSLLFPDVLGVSDPPEATLTEPAKRKSELNSAYTTQNTKKVKGSEVQIEIWKIDLEFSKKVFKDKPQLAEAMINARERSRKRFSIIYPFLKWSRQPFRKLEDIASSLLGRIPIRREKLSLGKQKTLSSQLLSMI